MSVPVLFVQDGSPEAAATTEARVFSLALYVLICIVERHKQLNGNAPFHFANEMFAVGIGNTAIGLWPEGKTVVEDIIASARAQGLILAAEYQSLVKKRGGL